MASFAEIDSIVIDDNHQMPANGKMSDGDGTSLSSLSSFSSGLSNDDNIEDLEEEESLGEYPNSHYDYQNSIGNMNMIRSVSDYEISTNKHRKKIKLDPLDLKEGSTTSSFLRNIGNWFRGSTRSTRSVPNQKSSFDNDEIKPGGDGSQYHLNSIKTKSLSNSEITLHSSPLPDKVAPRKVLHLNGEVDLKVLINDKSSSENSQSRNDVDDGNFSQDSFDVDISECKIEKAADSTASDVYTTTLESSICFELRSEDPVICRSWKRLFRNVPSVRVIQKSAVKHEINADAFIIPGNSFGILDGWPEIQFVDLFGWKIQDRIKEIIQRDYDGELLVGQSILLPRSEQTPSEEDSINSPVATSSPLTADAPTQVACNLNVKYLIYVPVMRVPLHVDNTANAYLAFKSAIKSVTRHNEKNKNDPVRNVVCPELCSDFGKMPPHRIAYQMKLAFDTFALDQRPDIKTPADLGHMATEHVRMTTSSEGSWF